MQRARGFTLLEVLVAFAIAAMALTALTATAAAGLRSSRVAAHTEQALSRARSRLAVLALDPRPGEQSGDDGGGFRWRTLVRPAEVASEDAGPQGATRPGLFDIQVRESWASDGGERGVTLDTLRIGSVRATP